MKIQSSYHTFYTVTSGLYVNHKCQYMCNFQISMNISPKNGIPHLDFRKLRNLIDFNWNIFTNIFVKIYTYANLYIYISACITSGLYIFHAIFFALQTVKKSL